MKFKISGADWSDVSSKLNHVVKTDTVEILAKGSSVLIDARDTTNSAVAQIPADVEKKGRVCLSKSLMDKICRGKKEIEFTVKDDRLSFVSHNSKGDDILIFPVTENKIEMPDSIEPLWPKALQPRIMEAIKACSISSFFRDRHMFVSVREKKKNLYIYSADVFHAAIVKIELAKSLDLPEVSLPTDYAKIISSFPSDNMSLQFKDNRFFLTTDSFHAELPGLQATEEISFDDIYGALEGDKPAFECEIEAKALIGAVTSLNVAYEVGEGTKLKLKDDKLDLSYSSNYGKTSTTVKVINPKGKGSLVVNTENLLDITNLLTGTIKLQALDGQLRIMQTVKAISVIYDIALYDDASAEQMKNAVNDKSAGDDE